MQYFFQANVNGTTNTVALLSVYGEPDAHLLEVSSGALLVCQYYNADQASLKVVSVKNITSCIAMVPFGDLVHQKYFVCEKMGLEIAYLGGITDELEDVEV